MRPPHDRTYQRGEQTIIVHVGERGLVTMPEEQLAAVLALLGCEEIPE